MKAKDLRFGTLNPISENTSTHGGDRRRTTTVTSINRALDKAYEKDTLLGVNEFNGIVVFSRLKTYPTYKNRSSLLQEYTIAADAVSEEGDEEEEEAELVTQEYDNIAYKVYIPELDPRPAPDGTDCTLLRAYSDVYSDIKTEIPLGSIVVVRYEDKENLFNPRIVRAMEGPIRIDGVSWDPDAQEPLQTTFLDGNTTTLRPSPPGRRPTEPPAAGSLSFTWAELGTFSVVLRDLLNYIAAHEGNYESINRGCAGDSPGGAAQYITGGPAVSKNLTGMSIAEVRAYQKGGSNATDVSLGSRLGHCGDYTPTPGFLAVGKYQMIPVTLKAAVDSIKDIPLDAIFNSNSQERFGAYLLLMKRASLGKYLVGEYSNVEWAAQEMAYEWASQPLQFPFGNCVRGQSAYCGSAGNRAAGGLTPQGAVRKIEAAAQRMASAAALDDLPSMAVDQPTDDTPAEV